MHKEMIFTGFGGQGIILAGYICGKAASIYENLYATLTQNYGPESRGGACSAQLIVSDKPIFYPHPIKTDILVALSAEGYQKNQNNLTKDAIIITDQDLVPASKGMEHGVFSVNIYPIPATRLAESLGKKMVANIVVLGFVTALTKIVSKRSMMEAIKTSVPEASIELNLLSFEKGFNYKQV
ncbi:MAG: 2-oxoacid:acceptor oxidoreductase family protein [Planctomycetota bacterium]|nr:2-oxoacid:acceptor oxidoreductase family protein [Planctomycetota bacterium]MDI6786799.1 2-oxoacid:acceptor oxidoreductase family protein [Planctomycetota bacterium]